MRFIATMAASGCLLLIAADFAGGQQARQPAFEPRSNPGAGQKYLEKFTGEWSVTKTFYPRSGEPTRAQGRCRQTMIHDGRFLQSDFVFQQGGKETTGLGIIGFEPETERFTSFWTDSRQTRMSVRQSKDRFDGKQIILFSRSLEGTGDEARRSKTVSRLEDEGRTLLHRQFSLGAGGEERLVMELAMKKITDADAAKK